MQDFPEKITLFQEFAGILQMKTCRKILIRETSFELLHQGEEIPLLSVWENLILFLALSPFPESCYLSF